MISALEAGYKVRAVVRRPAAAEQIKTAKSAQRHLSNLDIVFIQDLLQEGSFDEAVIGVDYILHIASPVSRQVGQINLSDYIDIVTNLSQQSDNYYADFIEPAVQGTLSILRSAAKSPSVKRVVITSSIAVLNLDLKPVTGKDLAPVPDPHTVFPNPFAGYSASKKIALAETERFLADNKPNFDVVHILPAVILGRNELASSTSDFASGTNRYAMNIALGIDAPAPMIGATVHVNDVGLLHVQALDENVKVGETGVRNFIASGGSVTWSDVSGIIENKFGKEGFKLGGKMDTREVKFDTSLTEKVFGTKWVGFEEQVKSVVGHYLEVKAAEEK